ncbi:aminoacyl-tRNA hydrolase [Streptomyces varsoviensis]|uniref:aminoacyl-tRNA hydrolase n=1 Tax=Streptomyces varsoviensis TaxID=67373 RepID=UPI0033EC9029
MTSSPAETSPFRHEDTDRDAAPQYVLPLVVHIEKAAPPARTDALETAARAVLTLLADERSTADDGEWAQAVRDWQDARIRKVVRRARGAEWRRAEALPGITVRGRAAEVRVYPPVPLDGWPKELIKLQVSGTDLTDPEPLAATDDEEGGGAATAEAATADAATAEAATAHAATAHAATADVAEAVSEGPVLWLNPDLDMSAGKAMAQAGHGAQLAWWELDADERAAWRDAGFPLAVRTAEPRAWATLTSGALPVVRDAGFTEIAPGSCTVVADHPALRHR